MPTRATSHSDTSNWLSPPQPLLPEQATALLRVLVGSGARRHGDGSSVLLTLW